jgi:pre-mRNA-splicing factor ATP-dependent RNA helicase DHX38/PRP16
MVEGINAVEERRDSGVKGLGEFQRRSNRDRGYDRRNWDDTPRSERGGSVRVPNVGWESTPRNSRGDGGGWGGVGNRSWDAQTPRVARDTSPDGDDRAFGLDSREWEEEQVRLDRDWYTGAEEGGVAGDEEHNPLSQYEDLTATKEAEIASKQIVRSSLSRRVHALKFLQKKVSARQAQYVSRNLHPPVSVPNTPATQNADNDLWESNRMVTSGVATRQAIDLDFEDESESTVHVMVHDLKPPFLDGRTVFTKQLDPINPIRDPTSDLAVFSRKGSALVKEKRDQAERAKAAAKMAALGGTSLGNIMGVKDEEGEGAYKHNHDRYIMLGGHSRSLTFPIG